MVKRWNMRAVISTVDIKEETEGPYVKYQDYANLENAVKEYRGWLQYIKDITFDRDGYKRADDLKELVDEVHSWVTAGLDEEQAPLLADRDHGDSSMFPGKLLNTKIEDNRAILEIETPLRFVETHYTRKDTPCFVRGLPFRKEELE